jgi:hypothetical protein
MTAKAAELKYYRNFLLMQARRCVRERL